MIELVPAIDIIDGKCVRLTKGDYATQKTYNEDPVAVAREFENYGLKRLHIVDLDGARSKHIVNHTVLERIASATNLKIDFGGGIKSDEDLHIAFECGASMVTVGSIAVTQPETFMTWAATYGSERMILGADVKNGLISINGWKEDSGEQLIPFLHNYLDKGIKHVLCTEISKDGMLQGPSFDLYTRLQDSYDKVDFTVSGGISSMKDIEQCHEMGLRKVIVGKAIYENRITLKDIERWLLNV